MIWESNILMFGIEFGNFFLEILHFQEGKTPKIISISLMEIQHFHGKGMLSLGIKKKIILSLPTTVARCHIPTAFRQSSVTFRPSLAIIKGIFENIYNIFGNVGVN